MPDLINPDRVKMTKTYSISLGDANRIKEMGEFLAVTDAEVLHQAVSLLYKQTFPNSDDKDAGNEAQ